jgi:hypothetical protein
MDSIARIAGFLMVYTRILSTAADAIDPGKPDSSLLLSKQSQDFFLSEEASEWRATADQQISELAPAIGLLHWAVGEMHKRQCLTLPKGELKIVLKLFEARIRQCLDSPDSPDFPTTGFCLSAPDLRFAKDQWFGGVGEFCTQLHRISAAIPQKTIDASAVQATPGPFHREFRCTFIVLYLYCGTAASPKSRQCMSIGVFSSYIGQLRFLRFVLITIVKGKLDYIC